MDRSHIASHGAAPRIVDVRVSAARPGPKHEAAAHQRRAPRPECRTPVQAREGLAMERGDASTPKDASSPKESKTGTFGANLKKRKSNNYIRV